MGTATTSIEDEPPAYRARKRKCVGFGNRLWACETDLVTAASPPSTTFEDYLVAAGAGGSVMIHGVKVAVDDVYG